MRVISLRVSISDLFVLVACPNPTLNLKPCLRNPETIPQSPNPKRLDLSRERETAGDSEGDTPLAHARLLACVEHYFRCRNNGKRVLVKGSIRVTIGVLQWSGLLQLDMFLELF